MTALTHLSLPLPLFDLTSCLICDLLGRVAQVENPETADEIDEIATAGGECWDGVVPNMGKIRENIYGTIVDPL